MARTVARALALAADEEFAFVLLDLTLPDGDGRDVARALRQRSSVPILILTARGTETDRIVGLELGADDYVVKPFSGAEVIARMRVILRRSAPGEDAAAARLPQRVGELEIDPGARRVTLGGDELTLARKEFDLLAELMRHAGRVVSREDLMPGSGTRTGCSTRTLDVHVRWLRQLALSLRDRVDAEVRSQARGQADIVAATVAGRLEREDRSALAEVARSAAGNVRGRVILVDGSGLVLADSAGAERIGSDYGGRPEIATALRGQVAQDRRASETLDETILATAVPVATQGVTQGAVRITQSVDAVGRATRRAIIGLILVGLLLLARRAGPGRGQ